MIKKHCVSCGKKIPGTKEWYEKRGNYCKECSYRAAENVRKGLHKKAKERVKKILADK